MSDKTLVISNLDPDRDAVIFTNDRGSWNVSRALRDCADGKHGLLWLPVEDAFAHNRAVEVEPVKVARFARKTRAQLMAMPLLAVMEDGAVWLIDGHHRLRAMHRKRMKEFTCYLIAEDRADRYRVLYNGERLAPFALPGQDPPPLDPA